jgi:cation transport ATPase
MMQSTPTFALCVDTALAIGEAFTAAVIVLFVLVAEVLEHMTVGRGRRAIKDLLDLLPRTVAVRRDGAVADVAAGALVLGEIDEAALEIALLHRGTQGKKVEDVRSFSVC